MFKIFAHNQKKTSAMNTFDWNSFVNKEDYTFEEIKVAWKYALNQKTSPASKYHVERTIHHIPLDDYLETYDSEFYACIDFMKKKYYHPEFKTPEGRKLLIEKARSILKKVEQRADKISAQQLTKKTVNN